MIKFLKKTLVFLFIVFLSIELLCRIIIDPIYFYKIDTYNIKEFSVSKHQKFLNAYSTKKTEHVDFLFIGSSRVPATINPNVIMQKDSTKTAIVAGRGYMTAGIHYQALKFRVSEFPDFLKNVSVLIEYPGNSVFSEPFNEQQYRVYEPILSEDKAMPHLLLPHLNFKSFRDYLNFSPNSLKVKADMIFLFFSSFYRSRSFVTETLNKMDTPLINKNRSLLSSDGGIRNDRIGTANKNAVSYARIQKKRLEDRQVMTIESLDSSSLAYFNKLIIENGGDLFLYKMPLHSLQSEVFQTEKEKINKIVFEKWLNMNGITIIQNSNFKYDDSDFPDTWHLRKDRRDVFTNLLYEELITQVIQ